MDPLSQLLAEALVLCFRLTQGLAQADQLPVQILIADIAHLPSTWYGDSLSSPMFEPVKDDDGHQRRWMWASALALASFSCPNGATLLTCPAGG